MSGRKALIKKLVEGGARLVIDAGAWRGEVSMATRHSVYLLRDAVCIAVHRQDTGSSRRDFIGMSMVGWLVDEDAEARISPSWQPGAGAILVKAVSLGESLALTSPVIHVRREAEAPPVRFAAAGSMTRIRIPMGMG